MTDNKRQVNVLMEGEIASMLDALIAEDTKLIGVRMDRSKIVKRLIRQEYDRRQKTGIIVAELPAPEGGIAPVLIGVSE